MSLTDTIDFAERGLMPDFNARIVDFAASGSNSAKPMTVKPMLNW